MLLVLCDPSELDEDGVVIEVGEVVSRLAVPNVGAYFATGLDESPYRFDQYALADPTPGAVLITGRVVAIDAIYTAIENVDGHGFSPVPGGARTVSLTSTAVSRVSRGYSALRPHDEDFNGWRFALDTSSVTIDPPT